MSIRPFALLALGGTLLLTLAVVGCASTDDQAAATALNELNEHPAVKVGTCELAEVPTDLTSMRPEAIPTWGDPLAALPNAPPVSADRVLTKVDLSMTLTTRPDGARAVEAFIATVAQGDTTGTLRFAAGSYSTYSSYDAATMCTGCSDMNRRAEHLGFFEDDDPGDGFRACGWKPEACASSMTLGDKTTKLNRLLLQWEGTGEQWMVVGYGRNGGRPEVMATAARCTFDPNAWKLLRNVHDCSAGLFDGTSTDAQCLDAARPLPSDPR